MTNSKSPWFALVALALVVMLTTGMRRDSLGYMSANEEATASSGCCSNQVVRAIAWNTFWLLASLTGFYFVLDYRLGKSEQIVKDAQGKIAELLTVANNIQNDYNETSTIAKDIQAELPVVAQICVAAAVNCTGNPFKSPK
jgi:vancomycin permeability regulator SanA